MDNSSNYVENMNTDVPDTMSEMIQPLLSNNNNNHTIYINSIHPIHPIHQEEQSFEYTYYYNLPNQVDPSQIEVQYVEYDIPDTSNEDLSDDMLVDSEENSEENSEEDSIEDNTEDNEEASDDSMPELEEVETHPPPTPLTSPTDSHHRSTEIMYENDIEIQTEDNGIGIFAGNINMNVPQPPTISRRQYRNSFWTNRRSTLASNANMSLYTQTPEQLTNEIRNMNNTINTNNRYYDFRSRLIHSIFPSFQEQEERQLSNVLHESLYQDTNRYKHIISEDGKKDLKHKTFFLNEFKEQTNCPITQDDFEEGQLIIELPCHHIFEPDSIMKWLNTHSHKCPVCRYELDSIEVAEEDTQENNNNIEPQENNNNTEPQENNNNTEPQENNNTQPPQDEEESNAMEQMVQFLISNEMMSNDSLQQVLWESILGD